MKKPTKYLSELPEERIEKYLGYPYYIVRKCGGMNKRRCFPATSHLVNKNGTMRNEEKKIFIEFKVSKGTKIIITKQGLIIRDVE